MIKTRARALVIWGTAGHESSLDHTLGGFGERERSGDLQMNTIIRFHIRNRKLNEILSLNSSSISRGVQLNSTKVQMTGEKNDTSSIT